MADSGFGVAITFQTGFFAEILSVDPPNMTRAAITTTHSATSGGKATFIPSDIVDMGEMTVEMAFDPEEDPPIDAAAETVTLSYPVKAGDTNPATWVFSGFMTSYQPTVPIDDRMTARAVIKVSGDITVTAGS